MEPLRMFGMQDWTPGETAVVCRPGILARAASQFQPVESLLPAGRVIAADNVYLATIVDLIEKVRASQGRVALIGASMGGMEIPFIVEGCRRRYPSDKLRWLKTVIIDAPNGAETMKELPGLARPAIRSGLTGPLIGAGLMKFLKGPKDHEIDVPSPELMIAIAGQVMSDDEWRDYVKRTAMDGMSGFRGRQWWSWIEWMMRVGSNGSLERATASLVGVKTTYVACTHPGNVTIVQPEASQWWHDFAGARVVNVDAVHCGFLQQPERFREAFQTI